jgi:hypothetical protein
MTAADVGITGKSNLMVPGDIGKLKKYGSPLFMKKNGTRGIITAGEYGSVADIKNL